MHNEHWNNQTPSVLLYHIYIVNNWKEVSFRLLKKTYHKHIYVHVSYDWYRPFSLLAALIYFKSIPKVKRVLFTPNKKTLSEVAGFVKFKRYVPWKHYDLMTYMHGKGVTKPQNKNVEDWVEFMRYFQIEKEHLCYKAFSEGFCLYGVNLGVYDGHSKRVGPYVFSNFHYAGNFVTINLKALQHKLLDTPIDDDYYGLEAFWGKLCSVERAFCGHLSSPTINNHYLQPYPPSLYRL